MTRRTRILLVAAPFLALTLAGQGWAISDCLYAGVNFSDGAVSCHAGQQFRCSNGSWYSLDLECTDPSPTPTVIDPADCSCSEDDVRRCDQSAQACCVRFQSGRCIRSCCPRQR